MKQLSLFAARGIPACPGLQARTAAGASWLPYMLQVGPGRTGSHAVAGGCCSGCRASCCRKVINADATGAWQLLACTGPKVMVRPDNGGNSPVKALLPCACAEISPLAELNAAGIDEVGGCRNGRCCWAVIVGCALWTTGVLPVARAAGGCTACACTCCTINAGSSSACPLNLICGSAVDVTPAGAEAVPPGDMSASASVCAA